MLKKIPVLIDKSPLTYASPLTYFEQIKEQVGEDDIYILESLSGPDEDIKGSLIGFDRLVRIEGFNSHISVTSKCNDVLNALRISLSKFELEQHFDSIHITNVNAETPVDVLKTVQNVFSTNSNGSSDSYEFGYFGYFSYEMVSRFEDVGNKDKDASFPNQPDMVFDIYASTIQFDLENRSCQLIKSESPYWDNIKVDLATLSYPKSRTVDDQYASARCGKIEGTMSKDTFFGYGERVMEHIAKGDVYQLQLGHETLIESSLAPFDVYMRMRDRNPAPYMYYAPFGNVKLIGASPEVFVKLEGSHITMRPIAGTVRRSADNAENERLNRELLSDEKELAEHLMLVDLCRNDIGRVAQPKTLDVTKLMCIEEYSHVNHIVSTVCAELSPKHDKFDLLCQTFPAGTMTGTPKVRAMEIIDSLEHTARGIYSGFVGVIDFNGYTNTALVIRSTVYHDGVYSIRASAGFVADSTPEGEWNESIAKLSMAYWAITGKELER